jgi:phosphoribosylformylglycinamidine (FGAM) synthase-like enzyme
MVIVNLAFRNHCGVQVRMTEQTEIERMRDLYNGVSSRLITVEVELRNLCASFAKHEERDNERNQRVPIVLLGVISMTTGVVSVLVQLWITRGP